MTISYFDSSDGVVVPTKNAAGPWSPDMLHGRLLGGLAARAVEREYVDERWRVSRLTVDMFRPAGFEPITIVTRQLRRGRRIVVVDVYLTSGTIEVGAVRAVVLAEGKVPPGTSWQAERWESPAPDSLPPPERVESVDHLEQTAWDFRVHQGGFGSGNRSRMWTNESGHLIDDEPLTPLVRAALTGDLASPLVNGGDKGVGYINADYSLALARYPTGPWVGLEATTHLASDGIAIGTATMYDLVGPFATSTTTALSNPLLT